VELVKEKYQLYLEWNSIHYTGQVAVLDRALFYGPVLNIAFKLLEKDSIKLDFTAQQQIFLADPSFYVATLSWAGIHYHRDSIVELKNCTLEHNKAGSLKALTRDNFFIIDCEPHEEHIHIKNLIYKSWVLDDDGYPLG
jgi:hypothetical protein